LLAKIADGSTSSGIENYKEFWYALVGWNSEAQSFNGNGPSLRLGSGSGADISSPSGALYGKTAAQPQGIRPVVPSKNAPLQDKLDCYKNPAPNMAATAGSTP
jgi:hypothetical protein